MALAVLVTRGASCSFDSKGLGLPRDAGPDSSAGDGGAPVDGGPGDDGGPQDAGPDAAPDAQVCPGDQLGFTISNVEPCVVPVGGAALNFNQPGSYLVNTLSGAVAPPIGASFLLPGSVLVQQTGSTEMVRVVSVSSFAITAGTKVRVIGGPPLVIVSRGDVLIAGTIDASANEIEPATPVPGGSLDRTACGARAGMDGRDSTASQGGGGGGGGGAFQGAGGDGGDGAGQNRGAKGPKGVKPAMLTLIPLRGGCPGGNGGSDNEASATDPAIGGEAGLGGGAIQISAGNVLTVSGGISVSGAGGGGGDVHSGGGGGGSGGGILLEAKVEIRTPGILVAAGGGGSSGGGSTSAQGAPGGDGHDDDGVAASGGDCGGINRAGGRGGGGGAGLLFDGAPGVEAFMNTSGGGGGGGGGVGLIQLRSASVPLMGMRHPPAITSGL